MIRPPVKRLVAVFAALALAGCSGGGNGGSGGGENAPPLIIHAVDSGTFQEDFNPYHLEGVNFGTSGMIHETLMYFNKLKPGEITPWLALKHEWSDKGKSVTFTLRQGVKWTDGKPFTADDVAFTFKMLKDNPELNRNALEIADAEALAPDKVRIDFEKTSYAKLFNIAGNSPIVPKHLWEKQKDPVTFTNTKPVGTGPYTLSKFSAQLYELVKNPDYWQPGKPEVPVLRFPAYTANAVQTALQQGEVDWAGAFVPDIQKIYVQGKPEQNKFFFPPEGVVTLLPNLTHPILSKPEVRQAINLAIDRDKIVRVAERGYTKVAHPTGVPMPGGEAYVPPEYKDAAFKMDLAKAKELLKGVDPAELKFTLLVPSPFTDWVNAAQLIREDLAKIGITVDTRGVAFQDWVSKVGKGNYELSIRATAAGPTPYYQMRSMLFGGLAEPVGESATGNYQRWKDAETDRLIEEYAATEDEAEQQKATQGLGKIMVEKLPTLPLFYSPSWSQYRTNKYVGWPSEQDPYAIPSPYTSPDAAVVLLRLKPAAK
ncbi:ABC transporter substrate-binding protein [Nonomuraea longispora]|uniref:ABC transporter substrate-binding protein n=1 Tax=Nonomuraea longispora TaxID=1848320 RepID=A0A4R4MIQ7_9ACTN|nr:ABC transporter substrate-binding protein [Nonomuraea longispora]TDB95668.1 ABC transporter substrate-binding protein [Nonomuraea longispora]